MASRSSIGKSGANEGGAYKGLDFSLIDRLEREFFFKKSMLTDWFGVSRQRIYKMLDVRDPKWQDCWTGKSLSNSETAILLELADLKQYDWQQEAERCCCMNDRQGGFVCIFVTKYELKAFFLEDLPEPVQNKLKAARMLSVMYALLEALSAVLDIERNDIKGCLHKMAASCGMIYSIVLYDAVAGGAGHVRRMVTEDGAVFRQIVEKAIEITRNCTCSPSCYACLRNYYNQKIHDRLNRQFVYDFLENFKGTATRISEQEFGI